MNVSVVTKTSSMFCPSYRRRQRHQVVLRVVPCVCMSVHTCLSGHYPAACHRLLAYYSAPIEKRSIVMSVSVCVCVCACVRACVCVCVCLSVRDYISRTARPVFEFLCMLPMAVVARSSSGSVVIRYVLPVLWMTSYLLISQGCSTSPPS